MILVRVAEITNISTQVVQIAYDQIPTNSSVTDIDATASGIIHLQPGTQFSIEADRLLDLKPLLRLGLITVTIRKIKARKPVPYVLNTIGFAQGSSTVLAVGDQVAAFRVITSPATTDLPVGVPWEYDADTNRDSDPEYTPIVWSQQLPVSDNFQFTSTGLCTWTPEVYEIGGPYQILIGAYSASKDDWAYQEFYLFIVP